MGKRSVREIEILTAFTFAPINISSLHSESKNYPSTAFQILMFLHRIHCYPEYFRASFPRASKEMLCRTESNGTWGQEASKKFLYFGNT